MVEMAKVEQDSEEDHCLAGMGVELEVAVGMEEGVEV